MTAAERLAQIRARLANASADYALVIDDRREAISARLFAGAEPVIIAHLTTDCPYADRDLIAGVRDDLAFLDELVQRHGRLNADLRSENDRLRRQLAKREGRPDKDYAAACAMKCTEPAFIRYLQETHGLNRQPSKTAIETRIRSVLAISSRKELNETPEAAARWRKLVGDFEAWRRG